MNKTSECPAAITQMVQDRHLDTISMNQIILTSTSIKSNNSTEFATAVNQDIFTSIGNKPNMSVFKFQFTTS